MRGNPLQLQTETLGQAVGRGQMRLICPNCDAEYEVDDAAIPDTGRDVQCSNCGHAWFEKAAEAAPLAPVDDVDVESAAADMPLTSDATAEKTTDIAVADAHREAAPIADEPAAPAEQASAAMPGPQRVDDAVLAILREEAEHELAARRAEAVPVETQPDLGLDDGAAVRARQIATLKSDAEPAPEAARQITRRELLPNIEEINSTLRPSSSVRYDDGDAPPAMQPEPVTRSGFRSGFFLMLVLAAVLVVLYVIAPRLAQQIPGAKGTLDAYVAGVDQARIGLDTAAKSVIGALQRLAGSE